MTGNAPLRLLLGPQRPDVTIAHALARSGIGDAPMGVISAAWQEAEGDIDDVRQAVARPLTDLRLYHRAETLFAANPALHEAYRDRQDRLKAQQRLYRLRLRQLMIAARATLTAEGDRDMLAAERRHAISQLRALDQHHLRQVDKINARYDERLSPASNPDLAAQIAAVKEAVSLVDTVLITGGNIVVLLNRLRLFGLDVLLRDKNIVGWSAGAMVLSERIVLFHERLPQGRRDAEVLGKGLGMLPGVVLLPDAKQRLRIKDELRVGLFDRRFSPAICMTLENGSWLLYEGQTLIDTESSKRMTRSGKFKRVRTA
jgi:uncharacterized protein YdcH (DUF465 family)